MKKYLVIGFLVSSFITAAEYSDLFELQNEPLKGERIVTKGQDLVRVAQESADFLSKIHKSKYTTVSAGLFKEYGITLDQVRETLEFIAETGLKRPRLLSSPWFFNMNFTFYRWYGDTKVELPSLPRGWKGPPECIRTTQYRITEIPGSKKKTAKYFYGLYEIPKDEIQLTPKEKNQYKDSLVRFKYSRSQIVAGALESNASTKPLAWVTEKGRREFAMQGSALINFKDGEKKLLRVAGSNGQPGVEKYWYACEVSKRPVNSDFPVKVKPRADVTYAGDIKLLGFGKIIALVGWNSERQEMQTRLGVLVDTGGAFKNNLSKLDMFTGYFKDEISFKRHITSYPHTAQAYILIKKNMIHLS